MKKSTIIGLSLGLLTLTMSAQLSPTSPLYTGSRTVQEVNQKQVSVIPQQILSINNGHSIMPNRSTQEELLSEGFDDITTLPGSGFSFVNASDDPILGWSQGVVNTFPSYEGDADSYITVNFNSTGGSVINNFMITPIVNLENGDEISFWTRVPANTTFPDRLEVRLDPTGANTDPSSPTDVGSYTELLLEINPNLEQSVYPDAWTEYTVVVSGLSEAIDTRVAFRYWITNSGPSGSNGDYVGIDSLSINKGTEGGDDGDGCDQENPSNSFENGFYTSTDDLQIIATDINVEADTDFTLAKITVNIYTDIGSTIDVADISFYDNNSIKPGALRNTQTAVVPVSQTVIGNAFGFDVSEVVFEISPELLPGQAGSDTTYWVSLYLDISSGRGYIDSTSENIVNHFQSSSLDAGATWIVNAGWDTVYSFEGECDVLSVDGNTLDGFTYYPNPTSDVLSLKSVNNIDSVTFFNLLGQKVLDVKVGATISEIDLSGLNTGAYIMHVSVEGQIGTYRVLKK